MARAKVETSTTQGMARSTPAWHHRLLPRTLIALIALSFYSERLAIMALAMQLAIMSTLVWKSSVSSKAPGGPFANVLRCTLGSLLLGFFEAAAVILCKDSMVYQLAVHLFFAFVTSSISDYMMHRFVWHAHWCREPTSIFWSSIRVQYVQHYLAHHQHASDTETIMRMQELHADPMKNKQSVAEQFVDRSDHFALDCSDHGYTVKGLCRIGTLLLNMALPTGTCMIISCIRQWSPIGIAVHFLANLFPLYLTIHHDKYHCSRKARLLRADTFWWGERWFWKSRGLDTMVKEHLVHHTNWCIQKYGERFFGLVPGGRCFIYAMWQTW